MKHQSKKLIMATLLVPSLLFFSIQKAFAASTGTLNMPDLQLLSGTTISFPLTVDVSGGDIGAFTVTLTYDKSVIDIASDSDIVVNPDFTVSSVNANASPATSTITGSGAAAGLTGIVTLADITVTATGAPGATTTITVSADPGTFEDSSSTTFSPEPDPAVGNMIIIDNVPDAFTFVDQTDVALNTLIDSAPITVTGINYPTAISIVNGEYSINGDPFTTDPGFVELNDTVIVRLLSSGSFSTPTTATLTIGGVTSDFNVTTLAQPINGAPVLQLIPDQSVQVNTAITFDADASDPNGDTLTFSITDAPNGATLNLNTGEFAWTPTEVGTFTFQVTVSDGTLTDSQTVTITVSAEQPVVIVPTVSTNKDSCGKSCEDYKEFRRKYKSDENRKLYLMMKTMKTSDPANFVRLENIYKTYRDLSDREAKRILTPTMLNDFRQFKKYDGYKHYRNLKERLHHE